MERSAEFFRFMAKREALRLRKEGGKPWPWSSDEILNTYKFTNVRREDDRTTRWMRASWTGPHENRPAGEVIFNCALFRYFGTIDFAAAVGWQHNWNPRRVASLAQERMQAGLRVFTGAYIIPTLGLRQPKSHVVCQDILTPLWKRRDVIGNVALKCKSWRKTAIALQSIRGFGGTGFMAKEVLQDVMQTPVLRDAIDRNTWCPAGPGARRGLNRLTGRPLKKRIPEQKLLEEMCALFLNAKRKLPTFMPELELHDIQFQLCEFDKYERVRLGEGRPKSLYRLPNSSDTKNFDSYCS